MSNDAPLADGIIFKLPHANAKEWNKGKLSFKVSDFIEFMQTHNKNGWVNLEMLVSRAGKPYVKLDTWEPQQQPQQGYGQPQQGYSQPPPPFPTDNANARQVPPPPRPADNSNAFDVTEESIDDIPF